MWNWTKEKSSKSLTKRDIEAIKKLVLGVLDTAGNQISENGTTPELSSTRTTEMKSSDATDSLQNDGISSENELKRDFRQDFQDYVNDVHQQMMRITIMKLETAERIDIEQLKMEQLKALRLKRIG